MANTERLLKECGFTKDQYGNYFDCYGREVMNVDLDSVVEAIVQECASIVRETRWCAPPSQEQIAVAIENHFGVK